MSTAKEHTGKTFYERILEALRAKIKVNFSW